MYIIILSFILGFVSSAFVCTLIFLNRERQTKEELFRLRAEATTSDSLQELIKNDFVRLANDAIKKEQEDLRKQNRETLEEKILPLTRQLNEFRSKVEEFNLTGEKNTAAISAKIESLEKNNLIIQQEAKNLVEALTKNQNVKGSYGENILDTILQSCGMREGIHYYKQFVSTSESLKDNEDHTIRPDVVINLPENRHLIIDSKVTLSSYLECVDDADKVKDFKNEVKKRIQDLANKNYQNAENMLQPDFVLMYVPIETSVTLLYEDADIINSAYKSNVIIVGTASLLAAIRLVNQLFAQQKQNESISKIVQAGTNLYETFVQFCEDLEEIKRKYDGLGGQLTKTINRFKRGNKNKPSLFSQVEELKEFGINTTKEIPADLLDETAEDVLEVTVND